MNRPVLVVMAAGLGSRYGGLKQLDPVGAHGELIIDYSLYDARRAGFETVAFVIKPGAEADFHAAIGARVGRHMDVRYCEQLPGDLPAPFSVPAGRQKPWGTAHAVLAARHVVHGPFAAINADDYYGPAGFAALYRYLTEHTGSGDYCMAGYLLENTVTEHGSVARGVCETDGAGYLLSIAERTRIERRPGGAICYEEGGEWFPLADGTPVSMNVWGFQHSFMEEAEARFPAFLERAQREDPLKAEYFLPSVVEQLLTEKKARVRVLETPDRWFGVTYREDKPAVTAALARLTAEGLYPENLWP